MMSIKQWLVLWLLFMSYLFLGAFIFYAIERRHEEHRRVDEKPEKLEKLGIEDLLNTYYTWTNNRAHKQLLLKLKLRCNITVSKPILYSQDIVEVEEEFQWTFYNSFFFALTTLSTIGYGNLHPTSSLGRMLVIVYSLLGIPLNGIVLAQLGEFFASTFLRAHQRYKGKRFETRFILLVDIATYLVPGILLFIFLPSGFFVYFEGWTFEQSIYFAFVTLTTIGYGDFVAGQSTTGALWYNIYKVVLIFWIMFGLGYLVMILGFISRALRCKRMARLEHKLAHNLKQTHSKILNQFSRDVSYVRRLLNEMYLLKFKPIYQDEKEEDTQTLASNRWQSAPNLTKWPVLERIPRPVEHSLSSSSEDEEETIRMQFEKHRMKRRKALSENLFKHSALRTRSETDLTRIDKDSTFKNVAFVESNELMARVADAFANTYNKMQDAQRNTTSDSSTDDEQPNERKISQFEKELLEIDVSRSFEALPNEKDSAVNDTRTSLPTYPDQWTWSNIEGAAEKVMSVPNGLDDYQYAGPVNYSASEKRRSFPLPGVQSLRRMSIAAFNFLTPSIFSRSHSKEDTAGDKLDVEAARQKQEKRDRRTGKVACPRKKRYSLCVDYDNMYDCINYYTQTREADLLSALKTQIGNLDRSSPILDQTSIGDFLRIVNTLGISTIPTKPKPQRNSSPLFTLFRNEVTDKPTPTSSGLQSKRTSFDNRRDYLMPKETTIHGSDRRHSLMPPATKPPDVTIYKSFSSHSRRRVSPSRFRPRLESTTLASLRRARTPFLASGKATSSRPPWSPPLEQPSSSATGRQSSRKIKRFLVKPVTLPPEIVVSAPSPDTLRRRSQTNQTNDGSSEKEGNAGP